MIVKILKTSGSFPAVQYNEEKVNQGVAERVEVRNFGPFQNNQELLSSQAISDYLSVYSETGNNHLKYPQFHVSFSTRGKSMSKEELMAFADQWLEKMGYASNPMVIYFHQDTDNNHLHVVTSRVGRDGKKINHSHERRRSQQAINEILGVHPANEAENIIEKALHYSFQSIGQFRSILESSSYETYEENGSVNVKKGGGVLFSVPVQCIISSFRDDDLEERRKKAAQLKAWLLRYKAMCYNQEELRKLMHAKFGVDLVFHGKGVGGTEFKPYGYTVVDHRSKTVFKGSDVLPLKQLLEFIPYSREEKEREIHAFIDDAFQKDNLLTTRGLNNLLKKQTNAYISKGMLVINGVKQPLGENIARLLRNNDRYAWIQSFNPRTEREKCVLAALFKVNPDYLSVNPDAGAADPGVIESIRQIAAASDARTFRDNLTQNGFTLFKYENDYYILNFKTNAIVNARDGGVGEGLLERPGQTREEGDSRSESDGLPGGIVLGLDRLVPEHPVDMVANTMDNILSIGGTGSGGVGGGGKKDLSKKRKKRKDDRDGGGMGY